LFGANDGNETNWFIVDNDNSSTRVGIDALVKANPELDVGAKFEAKFQTNDSNRVNLKGLNN